VPRSAAEGPLDFKRRHQAAQKLACDGQPQEARVELERLRGEAPDKKGRALVENDLAVAAAMMADFDAARIGFAAAAALDAGLPTPRANLERLDATNDVRRVTADRSPAAPDRVKVAILSCLFNWPSTAGGIVHTVELAKFLNRAGYEVRHFFARYEPWGIGRCDKGCPFASEPIAFTEQKWNVAGIQEGFRNAVDGFDPDYCLITDAWNLKPLLAEAVRGYPYILRQQALECICPLNNLRLLRDGGAWRQCKLNQLAAPGACHDCLAQRAQFSGALHQAERTLSGVGTPEYDVRLKRAFADAEAVLVLNPAIEMLLAPFCRDVRVVTWGMDPERFPWPWPEDQERQPGAPKRLFMAGAINEAIKGFDVLHEACALLWSRRQDFELVATGEPAGEVDPFTRFVGWLSQDELPRELRASDIVVMPTIAQEGLARSTVEAMGVGRPVVGSRIGGLPYTVAEGETGFLCEPGNAPELVEKIERLLDDAPLRERMGLAGRRRFEEEFTWDAVIERGYRPLLGKRSHGRPQSTISAGAYR
jgi:glycosyltransferase involved in cell wall biosynthesis